jgi:hypothetical protein
MCGELLEAAADEDEPAVKLCSPVLVGAYDADTGQLSPPSFAGDPASPVNGQLWHDHTNNRMRMYLNGAAVTIANLVVVLAFVLGGLVLIQRAGAADKTPMVQSDATTGKIAAAGGTDNVKVPGTLEVVGAVTIIEGALTDSKIVTADIKDGTITAADIGDAELAALGGLTSAANAIPYFTGSGTASVISSSVNMVSLLGSADYATARTNLGLAIGSNVQAYDADLSTYGSITPSANVQSLLGCADYAAMRTALGLVIGTNVQAYDADLATWAGVTPSANGQSLVAAADYAAMRTALTLVPGTDIQAYDADLATYGSITPSANVQTLLGCANNAAMAAQIAAAVVEGGLADSVVVTADIKDGTITAADIGDTELAALGGLTFADDKIIIGTGAGTVTTIDCTPTAQVALSYAANSVVLNHRHRVTVAEINAGHEVLAAISGKSYRIVDCKAIAYGGAAGTVTTVDVLGTQGAGGVKLVAYAQASLTQSTVLTMGGAGAAVQADGASYVACDANTAITIGKTGGNIDTATGVDFILSYVVE